jgi:actin-like ATPase involved in cell morphogenesis
VAAGDVVTFAPVNDGVVAAVAPVTEGETVTTRKKLADVFPFALPKFVIGAPVKTMDVEFNVPEAIDTSPTPKELSDDE